MYKKLYRRFLEAKPDWLHFAAHSHYYWPDITRDAHIQYWDDSANRVDDKWDRVLGEVAVEVQQKISRRISADAPEQIVFAPNTHELVSRVMSCFATQDKIKILTTDGEFHSFDRQIRRLQELGLADVETVSCEPFDSLEARLQQILSVNQFDLFYISTIFFNSGLGLRQLNELVTTAKPNCRSIVLDGYHSFCALPLDLSHIQDDVFFLAGGYKYAQSGEGVCFMRVPRGTELKPANTGWYAGFANLESGAKNEVGFSNDGQRFAGSTFDPSGLYRMNAVFDMFDSNNLSPKVVDDHVKDLQSQFLNRLEQSNNRWLRSEALIDSKEMLRGHFFAFALDSAQQATEFSQRLHLQKIKIDVRGNRARFGFGLYQSSSDIEMLFQRLESLD